VATDCPGGTRNIIVPGLSGWLAPQEDALGLANVMASALAKHTSLAPDSVRKWVQNAFGSQKIVREYEEMLLSQLTLRQRSTRRL
jgi:hypothetical protein